MATENERGPPSTEVSPLDLQLSACVIEGQQTGRAEPDVSSSTPRLAAGQLLGGRYRIERELGEGGMGVVYLAADEQVPGERFAIKVLKEELRPEALAVLREEVRKTRMLSHPNVVDVHSVNVDGQKLYVLMEFLEGKSLDKLLDEEFGRGMSFSHAWPIIEDVGAALGNAHDHNVIHSDLKPANVFLTTSGRTKLLDFGIARVSRGPLLQARSGPRALTPAYASCEMLEGKEADRRDDIYSFACVIYEMLSGERPFGNLTGLEARERGARVQPLMVLTQGQNAALGRALSFDREGRTSSVEQLIDGLGAYPQSKRRPIALVGTAIIGALVAGALVYLVLDRLWVTRHSVMVQSVGPQSQQATSPATPGAVFNAPPHSIAVLPFHNMSDDASQQYLSDGLSEDLITAISKFPGLKVIGRYSSFQFRDSKEDSKTVGAKLHVTHLLEGSVRRAGDVVRISAELVDTSDGSTQWSERYDRPYKDLFALQDDITRAVAAALKTHLVSGESASLQSERPPSGNLEAYDAVLEGKYHLVRDTEVDYRKAIERFTLATRLDPRYALAWSLLSRAWAALADEFTDLTVAPGVFAKARTASDTALALAPELANAHLARGRLLQFADFDWRGAEAEYRRALELAPSDSVTMAFLASQLATLGQVEKAIELSHQALAVDPLRPGAYYTLAAYLSALNRLDEAEGAIRRAIELQPRGHGYQLTLTIIEIQRGNAQAALAAAQQESPGFYQDGALTLARQISNDRAAADTALKSLIDRDATSFPYSVAQAYAIRGEADKTFEWLDRAWQDRDSDIGTILWDPLIARYRGDLRFAAFCRKVGLPAPLEPAFNPPAHSIAVLPFVNMSGHKEQEYFSDGLSEELLNDLSRINELQVAARTSSFSFKGKDTDIGTIARKLNVGAVLEGSVRRSGHTVRITAQLNNAVTGFHIWSQSYDRDLRDVLQVQAEIATAVAEALKVTLLGDVAAKTELGGTRSPAAFDAYLQGMKAHARGDAKAYPDAVAAYTEAIRLDPNYALAFAGRSIAYSNYAGEFAPGATIRESFDKAQADARQALAIAPELAEGYLALALYFDGSLDFGQESEAHERARALAPGNAKVLRLGGQFAVHMGHTDLGLAALRRAVVLDPLNPHSHEELGEALYYARRYQETIAATTDAISLDSNYERAYGYRGLAYYVLGDFERARASCEAKPDYWVSQWCLALTHAKVGPHAEAEARLAKFKAENGDASAYQYATVYAQRGNVREALEWLDTAVRVDPGVVYLKTDPLMDPLRKEPRFQAIERALKFPD